MNKKTSVKVWDIAVRLFHWSLVAAFLFAYITGEHFESLHEAIGYFIIGLIVFRIIWGLIGSKHARFTDFVYRPSTIITYLKSLSGRPRHYLGHNPAGGAMVIMMLVMLSLISWSGIKAEEAEHGIASGPTIQLITPALADGFEWDEDEDAEHGGDEFWEEVHEVMVNLMILLIIGHIAGVLISSALHRENLIRAMITGKKELPEE